jgi:hypothetical protein
VKKAKEFKVNKYRVYRRLKGIGPRSSQKPVNSKLSEVQEETLIQYILCLDEIGQLICYNYISNVANDILKEDYQQDNSTSTVGAH